MSKPTDKQQAYLESLLENTVKHRSSAAAKSLAGNTYFPTESLVAMRLFIEDRLPQAVAEADVKTASDLIDVMKAADPWRLLKLLGWSDEAAKPYMDRIPAMKDEFQARRAAAYAEGNTDMAARKAIADDHLMLRLVTGR